MSWPTFNTSFTADSSGPVDTTAITVDGTLTFDSDGATWDAGVYPGFVFFGFGTGVGRTLSLSNVRTAAFDYDRSMFRSPYGSIWHREGDGRPGVENVTVQSLVLEDDGISIAADTANELTQVLPFATELHTQYGDFELAALTSYSRVPVASGYRLDFNFGTVSGLKTARAFSSAETFEKVWDEFEAPNIFATLLPGGGLFPGTPVPAFEPNVRVLYLAWYIGPTEVGRKIYAKQAGAATSQIITTYRLDFNDAVGTFTHLGWWGGDGATATVGTGVEIDKVPFVFKKTNLDRFVVTRIDTKW